MINFNDNNVRRSTRRRETLVKKDEQDIQKHITRFKKQMDDLSKKSGEMQVNNITLGMSSARISARRVMDLKSPINENINESCASMENDEGTAQPQK